MKKDAIMICYTGRKGGGALDSYEIAKALVSNGETVIAVVSRYIENLEMWRKIGFEKLIEIETYVDKVSFVKNTLLFPFNQGPQITNECRLYNIVAIYCPMISFWTHSIFKRFPISLKLLAVHDPVAHSGANSLIDRYYHWVYTKADIIIVHSYKFVEQLVGIYKKVRYIPLGEHDLYKKVDTKKSIVSYPSGTTNFVFFGRITPYKGLDVLAEAYHILSSKYGGQITLTVVGNGDFSHYAKAYSELKDVVVVNRWISDDEVESVFTGNNLVCVCPYKDATQSGVVLTAYGYGVPVIASNTGGIEEQVENGITGYLVEPNSVVELCETMERFITNSDVFEQMKRGIDKYLNSISWKSSAMTIMELVRETNSDQKSFDTYCK